MARTIARAAAILAVGAACALATGCAAYTPVATPAPTMAACQEEDGSTPGQAFPCLWDAAHQGNGRGESFVLVGPVCEPFEIAASDAAHRMGQTLRLACDDRESQRR